MPEAAALDHDHDARYAPEANTPASDPPNPAPAPKPRMPDTLFVLDTTAIPGKGTREHEMLVDGLIKSFKFEPGIPLELPLAVAIKFLRHDAFKRTDKGGDLLPYHRKPKQPDELKAGERFALKDHETIAHYGELTNVALLQRALELPGGEMLPNKGDRQVLIDFITKTEVARRKANAAKQSDLGRDDFVPEPEVGDLDLSAER